MKRWITKTIWGLWIGILLFCCISYIFDPYFHFHKPYDGICYNLNPKKYMYYNMGVAKNFDFDTFVTGTSLTEHFSTEDINRYFGGKAVRLTCLGEGNKRIAEVTDTALANHSIKTVIRGLDTMHFISDKDFENYDYYPEYLYDSNVINDFEYIFNIDILMQDTLPSIINTAKRERHAEFDDIVAFDERGDKNYLLDRYERAEKNYIPQSDEDYTNAINMLIDNLDSNLVPSIEANPNTIFYIFFPPYSVLFWDSLHQMGDEVLLKRIMLEEVAIEKLIEYENVKLFSFFDDFELITNLDLYRDDCHYIAPVNRDILRWMSEDKHLLTKDNYHIYLDNIREFYTNYDYDSIYE